MAQEEKGKGRRGRKKRSRMKNCLLLNLLNATCKNKFSSFSQFRHYIKVLFKNAVKCEL